MGTVVRWADRGSQIAYRHRSSASNGSERWQANVARHCSQLCRERVARTLSATYVDQVLEPWRSAPLPAGFEMCAAYHVTAKYSEFGGGFAALIYNGHNAVVWPIAAARSATPRRLRVPAYASDGRTMRRRIPPCSPSACATLAATYFDQLALIVVSAHGVASSEGTAFGATAANGGAIAFYDRGSIANAVLQSGVVPGGGVTFVFTGWGGNAGGSQVISNNILMNGPKTAIALWAADRCVAKPALFRRDDSPASWSWS